MQVFCFKFVLSFVFHRREDSKCVGDVDEHTWIDHNLDGF